MLNNNEYPWKFCTIGGVTRVNIESGDDIKHLGELDQKLWTVLSCPVDGLEFDSKTLKLLDTDHDGKIRVYEILSAAKWLTSILKDPDLLLKKEDFIPFSAFNIENEDGRRLLASAKQILSNIGLEKDSISIADASDSISVFSKTRFNGDGIITSNSTDDPKLKEIISFAISTIGSKLDRSGEAGVDKEIVERFYTSCSDYSQWMAISKENEDSVFPFKDKTAAAFAVCDSLKEKIEDFYLRCKLVQFDNESTSALDVSIEKIAKIGDKDLNLCIDEISTFPIARVNEKGLLPITGGINPAWQNAFCTFKSLVLDLLFPGAEYLTEAQWRSILASFSAYSQWVNSQKGAEVSKLGIDTVNGLLTDSQKEALLALIEQDKALEKEAGSIEEVDKLLHLYRDFYSLLGNFVTFSDFYSRDTVNQAIFQAGTLYIDQRNCNLCIKVSDMAKHSVMASTGGMFLVYCSCVSKVKNETMVIAAVVTAGDVNDLKVGKNAIFYDRKGQDWDATVVKIIDNPIGIRQAFWSPYRKFGQWCSNQINKFASDKDAKVLDNATSKVTTAIANPAVAADGKKQAFDIAKFAGIFAAIGMALGYIGSFIVSCVNGFMGLTWWQMPLSIVAVLLVISGPSMIIAWSKLRKRNLSPLLNANGWAVNSKLLLNIRFGTLLTDSARLPKLNLSDPFAKKKMAPWKKALLWIVSILVGLGIAFAVLYFTNHLRFVGLPYKENVEVTVEQK